MAGELHVIRGLNSIVNGDNVRGDIDLKALEEQLINGGIMPSKGDAADRFQEELQAAAKNLGLTFGDDDAKPRQHRDARARRLSPPPRRPSPERRESPPPRRESPPPRRESSPERRESSPERRYYRHDETPRYVPPAPSADPDTPTDDIDSLLDDYGITREKDRRRQIDSVVGSSGGFSLEGEKREDMKHEMLAEIDDLMGALAGEGRDLSRIPELDHRSDYAQVESVMKILRRKSDHARYCSFAEEFILFGAHALEELFDGKRMWFDRYSPDLTGWHSTVDVKMKRIRHDTGQIVRGIMHDYDIGPGARVLLELIPNMVVYSKTRKHQHSQPGLYSDEQMRESQAHLRRALEGANGDN